MSRIVAIVGRPNVGKSTLFNRIVGLREAIVHDEPGVTRDRLYASTEWAGKSFTIIDTGGFVPRSEDVFEAAIREQAKIAIQEADVIIFVVDAVAGVTPLDEEIGGILRKSSKRVILVVNKVDSDKREIDAAVFHSLGFANLVTLSALGGRKIGDFLDDVTLDFPSVDGEDEAGRPMRLAIVGKPNVGKSSLVNALLGKVRTIVTDVPGTTRDAIDSILKYHGEEIILVDTAGLRRKSRIKESVEFFSTLRTLKAVDECDVAVLIVDVDSGIDKQDLRILDRIMERKRGIILAANKWDLVEKDDKTALHYEKMIRSFLREYDFAPIIFISATEKIRVFKLIDLAKRVFAEKQRRIATNEVNTVMLEEIAIHPPSSADGKEVKINYVTQVKTNPPAFAFFVNEPKAIQENYRRFLEGRLRQHFGFIGVPLSLYFRKKH